METLISKQKYLKINTGLTKSHVFFFRVTSCAAETLNLLRRKAKSKLKTKIEMTHNKSIDKAFRGCSIQNSK